MIAVDTNLLVRLATNDDPPARQAVVELLESEEILIWKTVLLETEWVLRSRFGYQPEQVLSFFRYLLTLPAILFEDEVAISRALEIFSAEIDFADALHVASSGDCEFVTMDRVLVRRAMKFGAPLRLLKRVS
jgi:predicted nucleic-acid-binding protein